MQACQATLPAQRHDPDRCQRDAMGICCDMLTREGFTVSKIVGTPGKQSPRPSDLLAAKGSRVVRVFVLSEREVDSAQTRERIRTAQKEGETLVCVPWPLKWRAISNIERWGLGAVAVTGW